MPILPSKQGDKSTGKAYLTDSSELCRHDVAQRANHTKQRPDSGRDKLCQWSLPCKSTKHNVRQVIRDKWTGV